MGKRLLAVVVTILVVLVPSRSFAWGFAAHQLIMQRAIDVLPPALKPFFEQHRAEVVMRVVDPDLWKGVGWDEDQNHFLDLGIPEYGKPPFAELPREHGAALEKFGAAALARNGLLPWREEEMFGNLRRAFVTIGRGSRFGTSDLVVSSSIASHYLQDAYQPFHATDNYDGQKTGNNGIHSRFETDLVVRYGSRLQLTPKPAGALGNARDAAFDALIVSFRDIDRILAADTAAANGREFYDDAYYEQFFAAVKPILEERMSAAVTATASLIVTAWERAGRPALNTPLSQAPARIRR
jgi:hypothetical protein